MRIYNTDREKNEVEFIKKKADEVVNPNGDIKWRGSMEPYFDNVRDSDIVFCSEYKEHVGKGQFSEIVVALHEGIPVHVIRGDSTQQVVGVKCVDSKDWAVRYGKVITI